MTGIAAVDTLALEDQVANDPFFQRFESAGHLLRGVFSFAVFGQILSGHTIAHLTNLFGTVLLAGRLLALSELVIKTLPKDFHQRVR